MTENLPKIHPRRKLLDKKRIALMGFVMDELKELTPSEIFLLLSEEIKSLAASCMKCEREDS